jgi:hypothetical protein
LAHGVQTLSINAAVISAQAGIQAVCRGRVWMTLQPLTGFPPARE